MLLASSITLAVTRDCRAGADYCVGTDLRDTLNGSEERHKIYGLDANDLLRGNGGDDRLRGGQGRDTSKGGAGEDIASTDPDADRMYSDAGNDDLTDYSTQPGPSYADDHNLLDGGPGNDWLYGHNRLLGSPGSDHVEGSYTDNGEERTIRGGGGKDRIGSNGPANDTIYAKDGVRDTISCGGGEDTVCFDKGVDSVHPISCENRRGS